MLLVDSQTGQMSDTLHVIRAQRHGILREFAGTEADKFTIVVGSGGTVQPSGVARRWLHDTDKARCVGYNHDPSTKGDAGRFPVYTRIEPGLCKRVKGFRKRIGVSLPKPRPIARLSPSH